MVAFGVISELNNTYIKMNSIQQNDILFLYLVDKFVDTFIFM